MRVILLLGLVFGCGSRANEPPAGLEIRLDIAYGDSDAQRLDLYRPPVMAPARLVVWVHGGAWMRGDKANQLDDKIALFTSAGWAFASVNYRLSPDPPSDDPGRIVHPAHVEDVARALHWLHANADELGLDSTRIAVLGHSAGAHLAALVALDAHLFAPALRCIGSFDTEAYDVPRALAAASTQQRLILINAFTSDATVQRSASPRLQLVADRALPAFLIAVRGGDERRQLQLDFTDALHEVGGSAEVLDASGLLHEEVNDRIGGPGDQVMTPPIMEFLTGCFE